MTMKYKEKRALAEKSANEKIKNRAEAFKQVFELMKHVTTLSSGSILILVTFMEKILKGQGPSSSVGVAFSMFCISIVSALLTMFFLVMHRGESVTDREAIFFAFTVVISLGGFFFGILNLANAAYPWSKLLPL